ncbi:MAG: lamin tail domain-containing protein [Elusimicrobiota bacterium]
MAKFYRFIDEQGKRHLSAVYKTDKTDKTGNKVIKKWFTGLLLSHFLTFSLSHFLFSAPWWDLRFTDGNNGTYDTSIENMLESYILGSSSMVYLANYSIPSVDTKITTSMNNRDSADLDVKYVGDGDEGNYTGLQAGIPAVLEPAGSPIMHNKFLIIDPNSSTKRKLVTGTGNYTSGGWGTQDNAWLTITDTNIINKYVAEYNELFGGTFHGGSATSNPITTANGITVHTLFSSEDGPWLVNNIVDTTIRAATESVFFETTSHDPTDTGTLDFDEAIWSVLDDAEKPNFFCEGVVNSMGGNQPTFSGTALTNYNNKGGYIRQSAETSYDKHHLKYVVIDMDWIGVGSMNANKSSSEYIGASGNDENHIFINDFRLARAFMKEFSRHYKLDNTVGSVDNSDVTEPHDWTAPADPTGLSVTPTANSFDVTWTAPADPGDFSRYYIFISTLNTIATAKNEITEADGSFRASVLRPEMQKKGLTTTSATLTTYNEGDTLVSGKNYYIGVVSVDKFGNESSALTGGPYQLGGNQPPNNPASMGQYKSDGITVITEGGTTDESTVNFKATISDPDAGNVKLQVEVKPTASAFDGTGLLDSGFVASGSVVTLSSTSMPNDNYHWRAVVIDTCSASSSWLEFGTAGNTDFTVNVTGPNNPPNAPTGGTTTPDGSVNWINDNTPQFSWTFSDPDTGDTQSAYQLTTSVGYDTLKTASASSSHTPASALADGNYTWNVMVWDNNDAVSPVSSTWTVKIDATSPTTPAGFDAGYNGTSSTLTWSAASDATSGIKNYKIYRATVTITDANRAGYFLANDDATPGYTDSTVQLGKTYYYVVTTLDNAENESSVSNNRQVICGVAPNPDDIVINEVFPDPPGADGAAELVELYNKGNTSVNINGWLFAERGEAGDGISDYTGAHDKGQAGTTLQPGWYALIVDSDYDGSYTTCINAHANTSNLIMVTMSGSFGLANGGDTVWISTKDASNNTIITSSFTWLSSTAGKSWEKIYSTGTAIDRSDSGNWDYSTHVHFSTYCTPGFANSVSPVPDTFAPGKVGLVTPVNNAVNVATTTALTVNVSTDATPDIYYYIELALDSGFTTGLQNSGWITSTSWNPTLGYDTIYYWRVKAKDSAPTPNETTFKGHTLDAAGYGTFTTVAPNNPPNAPTGGTTTPDGSTSWINNNKPEFAWTFSDPDAGNTQSAYQLTTSVGYDTLKTASATSSHTPASALPDGEYTWNVKVWDNNDAVSPTSVNWTVKIDASIDNPSALDVGYNLTSATLTWTAADTTPSGLKTYKIYRATYSFSATTDPNVTDLNGATLVTVSTYTDSTVSTNKTYYYGVTAVDNATNISLLSNIKSVTTTNFAKNPKDGTDADWLGTPPTQYNSATISNNEWIWKDSINDNRKYVIAEDPNWDITEFRVTADAEKIYFLVRLNDITALAQPHINIALDNDIDGTGVDWLGNLAATTLGADYHLTAADHYAERQICIHQPTGFLGKIELYAESGNWYAPPTNLDGDGNGDDYNDVNVTNNYIEFGVDRTDLGIDGDKTIRLTVAAFRNDEAVGWNNNGDTTVDNSGSDANDVVGIPKYGLNDLNNDYGTYASEVDDGDIDFWVQLKIAANGAITNTIPNTVVNLQPLDNGTTTSTTPTLSWNTSTDPDTGDAVTSYLLEFNNSDSLDGTVMYRLNMTSTSYTIPSALTVGTTYYWRVSARDSCGTLSTQPTQKFQVVAANNPPNAPTGGKTTPDGSTSWINNNKPEFAWTFSDPDAGDDQSAFQLITTGGYDSGKISSSTKSHTPPSPLSDGEYTWNVKVWDNKDAVSPVSSNWTVKIDVTDPPEPASFDAGYNGTSSTLTWSASTDATSGLKNYRIYRGPVAIDDTNKSSYLLADDDATPGYTDTSVSAGQTYYYAVTALDYAGNESVPSVNKTVSIPIANLLPSATGQWHFGFEADGATLDSPLCWQEPGTGSASVDNFGAASPHEGSRVCRFDNLTSAYGARTIISATCTVTAGNSYNVGIWAYVPALAGAITDVKFKIGIKWYDASGSFLIENSTADITLAAYDTWQKLTYTNVTAPSGATGGRLFADAYESNALDYDPYLDDAEFILGAAADTSAPGKVGLVTPANNAVNVSTTATLTVNTSTDTTTPVYYWIQIALDSAFTTGLKETGWQTSTSTSPVLANDTTYYWRVKAKDSTTTPNETTYKGHTLDADGYGKFVTAAGAVINNPPTAPTNGATNPDGSVNWINDPTPQFTWTFNDPDAGDSQSAFTWTATGPASSDTGKLFSTSSSYTPGSALADGTWTWQVMCWDLANSSSPWSASWTVKIDVAAPTTIGDVSASLLGGSIQLNWSAPTDTSGVKNYKIWRSTQTSPTLGANPVLIATDDAIAGYIDSSPIYGTTNYYYVSTVDNATNESALSAPVASCYIGPAGHIVISEVAVGVGSAAEEFVELYNPTDSDIDLKVLPNGGGILRLKTEASPSNGPTITWINQIIRAHGYFLFASSPAVNGVAADATYAAGLDSDSGVSITTQYHVWIDSVAWGTTPTAKFIETTAIGTSLGTGDSIERKANASSTATTMKTGGVDELEGNGYDTDNNLNDFVVHLGFLNPQNSGSTREPVIGNITLSNYDVWPDTDIATATFDYKVKYVNAVSSNVAPLISQVVIDGTPFSLTKQGIDPYDNAFYQYSTTLSTGTHTYHFYFDDGIGNTGRAPEEGEFNGPAVGPELEKLSAYGNLTTNPTDYAPVPVTATKTLYAYLAPGSYGWSNYVSSITYWTSTSISTRTKAMNYSGTNETYNYDVFWVELSSGTDYRAGEWFYFYVRAGDKNTQPPTFKFTDDMADENLDLWVSIAESPNQNTVNSAHLFFIGTAAPSPGSYEAKIAKRDEPTITSDAEGFLNDFNSEWIPGWRFGDAVDDGAPNNLTYNNWDIAVSVSLSPSGQKANCTFYYTTNGNTPTTSDWSFSGGASQSNNSNWNKYDNTTTGMADIRGFFPADLNAAGTTIWILAVGSDGLGGGPYTQYFKYSVGATPGTPEGDNDNKIVLGRGTELDGRYGKYPTTDFNNYSPLRHSQNEPLSSTNQICYFSTGTTATHGDNLQINASNLTVAIADGFRDVFYSDQLRFYLRTAFCDISEVSVSTPTQAYIVWQATTVATPTNWGDCIALLKYDSFGDDNHQPHYLKYHWLVAENSSLEGYSPANPSDCTKGAPEGAEVKYVFKVRDNQSTSELDYRWIYKGAGGTQRITSNAATAQASPFTYKVLQDDYTRPVAYLPYTIPGVGSITNGGVLPSTHSAPSWPSQVLGSTTTSCGSTIEQVRIYVGLFDTANGRFTNAGMSYGTSMFIDNPNYVHNTFRDPQITDNSLYYGNNVPAVNTLPTSQNSGIKGGRTEDAYDEGLEGRTTIGRRYAHDVLCYYVWRRPASSVATNQWSWIDIDGTVNGAEVADYSGTNLADSTYQMIRIGNVDKQATEDDSYTSVESSAATAGYISGIVSMSPLQVDSDGNGIWMANIPAPSDYDIMYSSVCFLYYRLWACNGDNDPQAYYNEVHGGCNPIPTVTGTNYAGSHRNRIIWGDSIADPYEKTFDDSSDVCRCGRVHDRDYGWVDITRFAGKIVSPPRVMIKSRVTVGGVTRTITTYLKVDPVTKKPTNIISTQVGTD